MNKQAVFAVLIFFIAGFLIFHPTLSVGFVSDDFVWLKESQNPQQFNLFNSQSFGSTKGRPGTMALFFVLSKFFSTKADRFHLIILVFHILNASLFFAILRRFQLSFAFSVLTALIFSIHFSNEETLFWVSSLSSIFCLFFYFCSVFLYLHYMKKGSLLLKFAIIVSMLVALSIREDAVSIPITLVLLNYIDKQEKSFNLSNLLRTDFIFLLPSCAFLGWRILGALQESMGYEFTLNPAVWVQNGLYFVLNLCVPIRFFFDQVGYEAHELLRLRIMTVKHVHLLIPVGLLLLVAIGFLLLRLGNKVSGLVRIGCILGVIGFLPYFALLGNAPRFIYFTLVGGAIVITSFIFWLSRQFSNVLCHLVTLFVGIIVVVINFVVVQERSQWWLKSAKMATTILQQTKVIADSLEPGDTMYVVNLPRRLNGAYVFHNGYPEAIFFTTPEIAGKVRFLGDKTLDELKMLEGKKVYAFENGKLKKRMDL